MLAARRFGGNLSTEWRLDGVTADTLWADVAERLRSTLNTTTYRTWFGGAGGAGLTDDAFVIGVPNDFTREWIEGHFLGFISAAVRDVTGRDRRVVLTVMEPRPELKPSVAPPPPRRTNGESPAGPTMNPKYTFDSFVIGSSNRFAHAAALAVAQ